MKNKLIHFAIHTDETSRAKAFYAAVFDWGFASYGSEDFLQIKADQTASGELIGALQARKYSSIPEKVIGLECTIGVEQIDDILQKVQSNGGRIVIPKTAIPHVGWIIKFLDTEGNLICALQADNTAH